MKSKPSLDRGFEELKIIDSGKMGVREEFSVHSVMRIKHIGE